MISRHDAILKLRAARWVRDTDTQEIFQVLDGLADRTRAVGGVVRDTILARYAMRTDLDLATELLPNEVMERATAAGMSCYPTGIKHGTVTVRNGQTTAEVTTLRQDVKTDGRHAEVSFGADWRMDAQRRDFTINALYSSINGALNDPLDGLSDLMAGRVRFIGNPDQRIEEDYLRVYRFFRFTAGYGGEICDVDGLAACQRAVGSLGQISAERVGVEMMKILALQRVVSTLAAMTKSKVLVLGLKTLEAMVAYEELTSSPVAVARLSIIFCERDPDDLQKEWRLSNAVMSEAREICSAADLCLAGDLHSVAYRHPRLGAVALTVAAAMGKWSVTKYHEMVEKFRTIDVPHFPIDGQDLISVGLASGPKLGKALRRIEKDWVNSQFELDKKALLARLKTYSELPL